MIDSKPCIARVGVPEIVTERVDDFIRVERAKRIGPIFEAVQKWREKLGVCADAGEE
jgi:hypothetical protein